MNRFASPLLASAAMLFAHSALPQSALACSPPLCRPALLWPSGTEASPAVIPLGAAVGFLERTNANITSDVALTARVTRGGTTIDGVATIDGNAIRLVDAQEGDVWEIHHGFGCSEFGTDSVRVDAATFVTIGPAADAPTSLGSIAASTPTRELVQDATSAGSCSVQVDAMRSLVQFASPLGPWGPLLRVSSLEVDGVPWQRFTSWAWDGTTPALDVFAVCGTLPGGALAGVTAGPHSVRIVATIPGIAAPIRSEAIDIDLTCTGTAPLDGGMGSVDGGSDAGVDGASDAGVDGGSDASVDGGSDASADAASDASVPLDDAGARADAGPHEGPDTGGTFEGQGCSASGRTGGLGFTSVLAGLALCFARRRRTR